MLLKRRGKSLLGCIKRQYNNESHIKPKADNQTILCEVKDMLEVDFPDRINLPPVPLSNRYIRFDVLLYVEFKLGHYSIQVHYIATKQYRFRLLYHKNPPKRISNWIEEDYFELVLKEYLRELILLVSDLRNKKYKRCLGKIE